MRRPSPRLAEGELTHLERVPEVDPADEQPDGAFVEDAVVVFDDLAVVCRAGAPSRRGEASTVRAAVEASGLAVAAIEAPGTLDGGDVLKVPRIARRLVRESRRSLG